MDRDTKLTLLQILLNYAIQDERIFNTSMDAIIWLMRSCMNIKYFGDSMVINWKFLHNLVEQKLLINNGYISNSLKFKTSIKNIRNVCLFLKRYFEDSSIKEVFEIAKNNITPVNTQYFLFMLHTYLKLSSKTPSSQYVDLLDDIFEIWQWP